MYRLLLPIFLVILFGSCAKKEVVYVPKVIEPKLIGKSHIFSPVYPKTNLVIETDSVWQSLLATFDSSHYYNLSDSFTTTNIDFSTKIVIATIDYNLIPSSIDITSIIEDVDTIFVNVEVLQQGFLGAFYNPFHIVSIPKSNKPIVFR